ncbi:MAG: hypothetical protein M1334_00195 [Patescibacteria group bacterium]|nr:hypothetical protein [Patescibacteria group bacterium]
MNKNQNKIIFALAIYAIAMAMVEAAVVIYLRELYYPAGFFVNLSANLNVIPSKMLKVELWREAATIIMITTVAFIAFPDIRKRIAAFFFVFSIWDLGYYLFLFLFIHWPASLSTIDIYFLIPGPWIGPVWLPIVIFIIAAAISFKALK